MEMQDNEFDELFRSKLDNFEAAPSANVWAGIAGELNAGKRRKSLVPLLSIAASIIVIVGAGLLFIPQKVKVTGKHPVRNGITKTIRPLNIIPIAKNDVRPGRLKPGDKGRLPNAPIAVNRMARLRHAKTIEYNTAKIKGNITENEKPAKTDDQSLLASLTQKPQNLLNPTVPDEATPLTIKHTEETTLDIPKPALLASQIPAVNKHEALPVKPKHKIRTLGDFINVVVASVDKRKDKIIEFSDTDNEGSNITGVNLGIIKIKKGE